MLRAGVRNLLLLGRVSVVVGGHPTGLGCVIVNVVGGHPTGRVRRVLDNGSVPLEVLDSLFVNGKLEGLFRKATGFF